MKYYLPHHPAYTIVLCDAILNNNVIFKCAKRTHEIQYLTLGKNYGLVYQNR